MINTNFLNESISDIEQKGLKRSLKNVSGPQGARILVDDREVLNFCSNNYLGLADDERLKRAAVEAIEKEGVGSGASRLVCGNMSSHRKLEETLAEFKGAEACLFFSTGYMANVGIISSLFGAGDLILSDKFNHASIIDGILLSKAQYRRYSHLDMEALEGQLEKISRDDPSGCLYKKKVIVTDSVFSMDGDIAPLDKIVELAQKYQAMVMVDEAHALGVLGQGGKGAVEHFGLEGKIDIQMGTLSKAAGVFGAYVCGAKVLIEFLINRARSFIYTTSLPPMVCAAAMRGIEIIRDEPERREQLWENVRYFKNGLNVLGFNTMNSQTPIIPVLIKDSSLAMEFSKRLLASGVFVQAIRPPTVAQNTARLRVTVMATHQKTDMDFVLEKFELIGKELCLI